MLFTGLTFLLVFLPVTLLLYYIAGAKVKPWVLLCANLFFYALGQMDFMVILCLLTVINTYIAMALGRFGVQKIRWLLLATGIVGNICLLAYYKYSDNYLLPLGLSFYTFKAISVIVDSYKGKVSIEKPVDVMNYLTFFGQVQSGPISRFEVKPPFGTGEGVNLSNFSQGVQDFLVGFSKKILIADVLVKVTDEVFASKNLSIPYAWLGAVCFSLQLYYDFSGYSDMAIGISRMFGVPCKENFHYPYATASIGEFWRRWHITLGEWFRDYVYIPLGGSRGKLWRTILNLGIVWLLTGIWHGNTGGFLLWGAAYFILIMFEKVTGYPQKFRLKISKIIYRFYSLIMINFLWVVFYYGHTTISLNFIKSMLKPSGYNISIDRAKFLLNDYKVFILAAIVFATPIVPSVMKLCQKYRGTEIISNVIYGFVLVGLFLLSLAMIVSGESNPFLYIGF